MKLRPGRTNPHTLYLQLGPVPDKVHDLRIGFILDPRVNKLIGDASATWPTSTLEEIEDVADVSGRQPAAED